MRDLEAEFQALSDQAVGSSGMTLLDIGPGVAVGRDATSSRIVLVDVGSDPVQVRDRESAGVWLTSTPKVDGRQWLALECRDDRLADVFLALAEEVVNEVRNVDPAGRRAVVQGHLNRWRQLLSRGSGDRLSREAEVGLHGELAVLARFAGADPNRALESWVGPGQKQHDFRWSEAAIEVKTTEARSGFTVTVHGLTQLEVPADGVSLHLAGVRLLDDPSGRTLPEVVSRLLPSLDSQKFLRLLLQAGYDHSRASEYEWARMKLDRLDFWRVTEATPGLRASDLPAAWRTAISSVRYRLDLAALGEPMEEVDIERIWTS